MPDKDYEFVGLQVRNLSAAAQFVLTQVLVSAPLALDERVEPASHSKIIINKDRAESTGKDRPVGQYR
jgi:hypothetical protein